MNLIQIMTYRLIGKRHYQNQRWHLIITSQESDINETIAKAKQFSLMKLHCNKLMVCNVVAMLSRGKWVHETYPMWSASWVYQICQVWNVPSLCQSQVSSVQLNHIRLYIYICIYILKSKVINYNQPHTINPLVPIMDESIHKSLNLKFLVL